MSERSLYRVLRVPIGLPPARAESARAETCERMAESLGPEMLTSARLPLNGVDLPRMLRPKSVIIKLTQYQCAGFTLAQGRAKNARFA